MLFVKCCNFVKIVVIYMAKTKVMLFNCVSFQFCLESNHPMDHDPHRPRFFGGPDNDSFRHSDNYLLVPTVVIMEEESTTNSSSASPRTDLPLLLHAPSALCDNNSDGDRLHHRHNRSTLNTNSNYSTALHHPTASTTTTTTTATTTSKFARGNSNAGSSSRSRYARTTRGARRVWLSAFAAFFGTAFIVGVHLFLYRIFMGGGVPTTLEDGEGGGRVDNNTPPAVVIAMTNKNGSPILAPQDMSVTMTLSDARSYTLTPLNINAINMDKYTIRINTYRRNEQLLLSINHHAKCTSVAAIHVIWCDTENSPPNQVVNHSSGKVSIEYHTINSLNERFKILLDTTPTLGILSLDDDVLRPCIAYDTAFIRWTRHYERMVGFDARTHVIIPPPVVMTNDNAHDNNNNNVNNSGEMENNNNNNDIDKTTRWKYGYMSTTETSNHYSMTLPRASFIHIDYYNLYIHALPRSIYMYVAKNLECEDVAMSFLVSSLTGGKPPLLADYWAVKSMNKLYSQTKISGGKDHKVTRDACVNDFASLLELKENEMFPLQFGKLLHSGDKRFFGYGAEEEEWTSITNNDNDNDSMLSERLLDVVATMHELRTSKTNEERMAWLNKEKTNAQMEARSVGMIENTPEWKARWASG